MDVALFNRMWPRIPHRLKVNLFNNTRRGLTEKIRESNRSYMLGQLDVYVSREEVDLELEGYLLALINADHIHDVAIKEAWRRDQTSTPITLQ